MRNIDNELINWAVDKINREYKDDVSLLIGQKGACKLPTDEQNIAFDFFVPNTNRGYNLSETFVIEDMGYDLFPMSWERLEGIANLDEKITFAFAEGVVLYARTKEDEERFLKLQEKLKANLQDKEFTFTKSLEQLNVAMDIFKTMVFDDDMSHVRKSAGGIKQYLTMSIATFNGTYLGKEFDYIKELSEMKLVPEGFINICKDIVMATDIAKIKELSYKIIDITRKFFMEKKDKRNIEQTNYNYEDLASWYYEARYSFRKIKYYCGINDYMVAYELGCYLQIEFDAIQGEFGLKRMDLLGHFKYDDLSMLEVQARKLEEYILNVLRDNKVSLKIYNNLEEFLGR